MNARGAGEKLARVAGQDVEPDAASEKIGNGIRIAEKAGRGEHGTTTNAESRPSRPDRSCGSGRSAVGGVGRLELPSFAVKHFCSAKTRTQDGTMSDARSNSPDVFLAEQSFGPDEQEQQARDVREPALDAAAPIGPR